MEASGQRTLCSDSSSIPCQMGPVYVTHTGMAQGRGSTSNCE